MKESRDELLPHIQSPYSEQWENLVRLGEGDVRLKKVLDDIFARVRGGVVIDVGAGQGTAMAELFTSKGARYLGVDPVPRTNRAVVPGAKFVEDDAMKFLKDRGNYQQLKSFPSRNFLLNGIDSIATSIPFGALASTLVFYMNPGDYVFGVYAPEMVEALREVPEIYEEVYYEPNGSSQFFAFRMRQRVD